ncbi:MAG: hypothetical protein ACLFNV_11140, partial [Desulfovibrionales bacterium]
RGPEGRKRSMKYENRKDETGKAHTSKCLSSSLLGFPAFAPLPKASLFRDGLFHADNRESGIY